MQSAELDRQQRELFIRLARKARDGATVSIRRGFLVALRAGADGSDAAVLLVATKETARAR